MPSEPSVSSNHEPEKGLPSVVPPSGKHIVQLFVVPGIIVAVALSVIMAFTWLVGGSSTPQSYFEKLQSPNPDIRWRAASDLAQVIKRDEQLALDADFALKLTEKFQQAHDDFQQAEQDFLKQQAKLSPQEVRREKEQLRARRNYALYLTSCLGSFTVPVGAPVLAQVARTIPSSDKETNALFRHYAVWALSNLGNNLKRFSDLPPERKEEVIDELRRQAGLRSGEPRQWAEQAADYLQANRPLGVIDSLAVCAASDDIFLRALVAQALNFWEESPEKNRLAEQVLVRLSEDKGQGEWIYVDVSDLPLAPSR
jgi:DNA-directed RNA polymerase subunit F